jgi:hypothetical protein
VGLDDGKSVGILVGLDVGTGVGPIGLGVLGFGVGQLLSGIVGGAVPNRKFDTVILAFHTPAALLFGFSMIML